MQAKKKRCMAGVRDWYKRNLLQSKNMETKMMGLQLLFFLPWSVDVIKKIRRNERGLGCGLNARNCVFLMGPNALQLYWAWTPLSMKVTCTLFPFYLF